MNGQPYGLADVPSVPSLASSAGSGIRDWIGITASIACAIHCAAMPFVIAFLPALGLSFLADEAFHQWMALFCFLIAIAAFVPGFRKHRRWVPMMIATVGLVLITGAAFGLAGDCCASCTSGTTGTTSLDATTNAGCECCTFGEKPVAVTAVTAKSNLSALQTAVAPFAVWITPIGGLLLIAAHLLNRRFGCLCGCCEPLAAD